MKINKTTAYMNEKSNESVMKPVNSESELQKARESQLAGTYMCLLRILKLIKYE